MLYTIEKVGSDSPFIGVIGLLLHNFEDLPACVCAVLRVAVNSDGFLERADVVLAVYVNAGAALLRYETDGAALAANDGTHHVTLHQQTQREVGGTRATGSTAAAAAATGPASAPSATVLLGRFHFHSTALYFATV